MNLKNCLNFFIIILLTGFTYAQTISGLVKDSEQNLLFGATVYNSSNSKIGIADEMGVFSVEYVKGENKLFISYAGYSPAVIIIISNGESIIDIGTIVLENDSLEEIVISRNEFRRFYGLRL